MGVVLVEFLAAIAPSVPYVTSTSIFRATTSAMSAGRRSTLPSAQCSSTTRFRPLT